MKRSTEPLFPDHSSSRWRPNLPGVNYVGARPAYVVDTGQEGAATGHLAAGICRSLIALDRSERFFSSKSLVQELQRVKADYALAKELSWLPRYALLVIRRYRLCAQGRSVDLVAIPAGDDRYERKSLLVSRIKPLSELDSVFYTSNIQGGSGPAGGPQHNQPDQWRELPLQAGTAD